MIGETRLKATGLWAAAAILAGIGIVEALDQFGAAPVLAAFFPAIPLAICLVVALRMRSLAFADMIQGGSFGGEATAWAIAGLSTGGVLLIAAPIATALGGGRGFLLLLAFLVGLALSIFLLTPMLRATAAPTPAAAIGRRFGPAARTLAALAIVFTLVPLLAAEASIAGLVASRMLGIPAAAARDALVAFAVIACLVGGARAAMAMAAVTAPIVAIAYLTPISIVSLAAGPLPMPWIGLFNPAALEAPTRLPATVVLAFAVCLVAGIATLPTLLLPAASRGKRAASRRGRVLALIVAGAVVLAAPSYGLLAAGLGIDATVNPAGLVVNFAERAGLSATPSVLLIGGLLTAALVAATAFLATAAAAVGNDLYVQLVERSAPEGRRIFIARIAALLLAVAAAALARLADGDAAFLAASGLSIGAASLGPLLLIGWHIPRVGPPAAIAALSVGLWLTVADIGLALLLPDISSRFLGMGTIVPTVLGPTGWFGLPVGLSGLTGVILGVIAIWAATELPRTDWPALGRRLARFGATAVETGRNGLSKAKTQLDAARSAARARTATSAAPATAAAAPAETPPADPAEPPTEPASMLAPDIESASLLSPLPEPAEKPTP